MSDIERIYHPWNKWECFQHGFFTGNGDVQAKQNDNYVKLLTDLTLFEACLKKVTTMWPYSCEHNLTNEGMNRVAWLGQASAAYLFGARADATRHNFSRLTEDQQRAANNLAQRYLDMWLENHEKASRQKRA